MQIETMTASLFAYWNAGELEKSAGTDKVSYRIIGGFKFQFRKVHFKQRSALAIEIMAALKFVLPALGKLQVTEGGTDEELDQAFLDAMPELIGALATPSLHGLIDRLCATAYVDAGNGSFEALAEDHVGERVFGTDITLQIPVAVTAAIVNLDTLLDKAKMLTL